MNNFSKVDLVKSRVADYDKQSQTKDFYISFIIFYQVGSSKKVYVHGTMPFILTQTTILNIQEQLLTGLELVLLH